MSVRTLSAREQQVGKQVLQARANRYPDIDGVSHTSQAAAAPNRYSLGQTNRQDLQFCSFSNFAHSPVLHVQVMVARGTPPEIGRKCVESL